MKVTRTIALSLLAVLGALPALAAENWSVDPVHSTAQFTARHFGIVPVIGTIPIAQASVELNSGSQIPIAVSAVLDASKLDTHNSTRDSDLRSEHYFNVATTPTIKFVSTKIRRNRSEELYDCRRSDDARANASGRFERAGRRRGQDAARPFDHRLLGHRNDRPHAVGHELWAAIVGNSIDLSINVEADAPQTS